MNFDQVFRTIRIIAIAITVSMLLPLVFIYFYTTQEGYAPMMAENSELLLIIAVVFAGVDYVVADFVAKKQLASLKNESAGKKVEQYRVMTILRFAIYEAASFISLIFLFMTGHVGFLIIGLVVFGVMFINLPTKQKFMDLFNLKEDELEK